MAHISFNPEFYNEQVVDRDPRGFLDELPEWNREIAQELASQEGLKLTDEHWQVLHYLRRRFAQHGQARYAREIGRELEDVLGGNSGSRRHLYQLFPGGPVSQGSRIAGLPAPPYTTDASFGSVH